MFWLRCVGRLGRMEIPSLLFPSVLARVHESHSLELSQCNGQHLRKIFRQSNNTSAKRFTAAGYDVFLCRDNAQRKKGSHLFESTCQIQKTQTKLNFRQPTLSMEGAEKFWAYETNARTVKPTKLQHGVVCSTNRKSYGLY
jgi:hypothetical protein